MGRFHRTGMRTVLVALFLGVAGILTAAPSGHPIVIVADSRRFTGWRAWWTNLYNESHLLFALLTIIIIPSLALVMGALTEFVLARIGINLKSRVLAEH